MSSSPTEPASAPENRFAHVVGVVARNRALTRLLLAYLVMILAEFGQWIALIVYAYARSGASGAGLVVILQLIPSMLLAPLITARLSRIGVAKLLAVAYAAAAATLACCGVAILAGAPVFVVYLAAVAFSLSLGVSRPLHHVLMPLVVRHPDELTAANIATSWSEGMGGAARPGARRCADQHRWPRSRVRGARRPVPADAATCERAVRCAPPRRSPRTRRTRSPICSAPPA